jgi:hypothetical protein
MTALLVGVTFVALGVAGALLFYVLRLSREDRDRSEARVTALAEIIGAPAPEAGDVKEAPSMFGDVSHSERRTGAPLALLAGVLLVVVALSGIYLWNRSGTASAAVAPGSAPLELVSLRHERVGERLVISGLVRNPHGGRALGDLAAVVFTFDRQGSYLASGRSVLDYRRLPPGEESPFSITLPVAGSIARYRVSFRTDDAVIPHLDRRDEAAAAGRGVTP